MRKRTIITTAAVLTVGALAVPATSFAANGGPWLLGRSNTESAATTVTNSAGTPLSLVAKAGYPALRVNTTNKVVNLNADLLDGVSSGSFLRTTGKAADSDKVDGVHASSLARTSGRTGTIAHDGSVDGIGAKCPSGTVFVSGGGYMPGTNDYIFYSGPDFDFDSGALIPNSWVVMGDSGIGVSNVTCYSPSGAAIPGVATTIDQTTGSVAPAAALLSAEKGATLSQAATAKIAKIKGMRATNVVTATK